MWPDSSEKIMSCMDFKCEAIEHIDDSLPAVFVSLHLFDPERRVFGVLQEEPQLIFKSLLDMCRQLPEVLFKGIGVVNPHALRSASRSSTEEKDFTLPAAISASASFSAFCQS